MRSDRPRPLKRYGQHFLERAWAEKVVAAIAPNADDRFLEIGPGPGALTLRLAPLVAHLTAIEIDRQMVAALERRVPPNVTLVQADFLEIDLRPLVAAGPVRVAGNLPYNVASPIVFRLIGQHRDGGGLIDATIMVQREVADRLAAQPGSRDYGVLSILVQLHARVDRLLVLPPGAFRPPPRVQSAVVRLRFGAPAVSIRDEPTFDALVRALFMQRRKQLANALAPFAASRGFDPRRVLAGLGIDARRRPETLQLTELARLADVFVSE